VLKCAHVPMTTTTTPAAGEKAAATPAAAATSAHPSAAPHIYHNQEFRFPAEDVDCIRCFIDTEYRLGSGAPSISVGVYAYDDRGRYADRINGEKLRSDDGSTALIMDVDSPVYARSTMTQCVKINLSRVRLETTSLLVCLDGGPRCFNNVLSAALRCRTSPGDRGEGTFLSGAAVNVMVPLFNASSKTKKDCLGIAVCVFYKDGWDDDGKPLWAARPLFEPVYHPIRTAKEAFCAELVIGVVPCLEKCRPRLFPSVRGVCAALSSDAFPKLKKKWFQGDDDSLDIDAFTEVIFCQLYETHPKILDELEAPYAGTHSVFGVANGDAEQEGRHRRRRRRRRCLAHWRG